MRHHPPPPRLAAPAIAEGAAWLVLCFTALGLLRPRGTGSPRTQEHA